MTDPKPTTSEQIALLRKWRRAPINMMEGWIDPNGIELGWVETLPDFEHDWAHVGPLWGEMVRSIGIHQATNRMGLEVPDVMGLYPSDDELKAAISHAWLAWKKEVADA